MLKHLSILLVAALFLSSLTFAQQRERKQSAAGSVQPASDTCAFTFTSGKKNGLTQYCVTANGNIAQFSAGLGGSLFPQEFLNLTGPAIEGYGMCDDTAPPFSAYYDYAVNDSGNWNPATAVATPSSVTITRTTTEGIWKFVQTIKEMKGSTTAFGAAQISMAITNLSPTDRFILLNRHAYIQGFFNDYDLSQSSVYGGTPDGNGNHLAATVSFVTTPFDFSIGTILTAPGGAGPIPCQILTDEQRQFFQGDGAIDQFFNLEVLPGKTKKVAVTYKPF